MRRSWTESWPWINSPFVLSRYVEKESLLTIYFQTHTHIFSKIVFYSHSGLPPQFTIKKSIKSSFFFCHEIFCYSMDVQWREHILTLSDICFSRRVPCPRSPSPAEVVTPCRRWIQTRRAFAPWDQTTDKVAPKSGDTRCLQYSQSRTGERNTNLFK